MKQEHKVLLMDIYFTNKTVKVFQYYDSARHLQTLETLISFTSEALIVAPWHLCF